MEHSEELEHTEELCLTQQAPEASQLTPAKLTPQKPLHWAKLVHLDHGVTSLEPRCLDESSIEGSSTGGSEQGCPYMDKHLKRNSIINLHNIGRSKKCDINARLCQWEGRDDSSNQENTDIDRNQEGRQFPSTAKTKADFFRQIHMMVSNVHCKLYTRILNNGFENVVEDCSGNGTFVNGVRLKKGDRRVLYNGDEICLINPKHPHLYQQSTNLAEKLITNYTYNFIATYANNMAVCNPRNMKLSQDSNPAKRPEKPTLMSKIQQKYEIREVLGTGVCGEVRKVIDKHTGQPYAIKILSHLKLHTKQSINNENNNNEAKLLQTLSHPYIVNLHEAIFGEYDLALVMELVEGGDLFDRIVSLGSYSVTNARRLMRRVFAAVDYLHSKNIIHRDLKPENILLTSQSSHFTCKLTDFGLAKIGVNGNDSFKTFCGTPQYFAPEVLQRRFTVFHTGTYTKQADVWSLGVILYIVLTGQPPFDADISDSNKSMATATIEAHPKLDDDVMDLLKRLLHPDPRSRCTIREACGHYWFCVDDGDTHLHPLRDPLLKGFVSDPELNDEDNEFMTNEDDGSDVMSDVGKDVDHELQASKVSADSSSAYSNEQDENELKSLRSVMTETPQSVEPDGAVNAMNHDADKDVEHARKRVKIHNEGRELKKNYDAVRRNVKAVQKTLSGEIIKNNVPKAMKQADQSNHDDEHQGGTAGNGAASNKTGVKQRTLSSWFRKK